MYIFIRQPEENLDIHPYQLYEVYAKNGILNISYGETFSRIFYLIKGYKTTNRIQTILSDPDNTDYQLHPGTIQHNTTQLFSV